MTLWRQATEVVGAIEWAGRTCARNPILESCASRENESDSPSLAQPSPDLLQAPSLKVGAFQRSLSVSSCITLLIFALP